MTNPIDSYLETLIAVWDPKKGSPEDKIAEKHSVEANGVERVFLRWREEIEARSLVVGLQTIHGLQIVVEKILVYDAKTPLSLAIQRCMATIPNLRERLIEDVKVGCESKSPVSLSTRLVDIDQVEDYKEFQYPFSSWKKVDEHSIIHFFQSKQSFLARVYDPTAAEESILFIVEIVKKLKGEGFRLNHFNALLGILLKEHGVKLEAMEPLISEYVRRHQLCYMSFEIYECFQRSDGSSQVIFCNNTYIQNNTACRTGNAGLPWVQNGESMHDFVLISDSSHRLVNGHALAIDFKENGKFCTLGFCNKEVRLGNDTLLFRDEEVCALKVLFRGFSNDLSRLEEPVRIKEVFTLLLRDRSNELKIIHLKSLVALGYRDKEMDDFLERLSKELNDQFNKKNFQMVGQSLKVVVKALSIKYNHKLSHFSKLIKKIVQYGRKNPEDQIYKSYFQGIQLKIPQ